MRPAAALLVVLALAALAPAAPPGVDEAVRKGASFLWKRYQNGVPAEGGGKGKGGGGHGIGPAALAGLAILEAGAPPGDPAVGAVAAAVREATYTENRTYQLALCLVFLDRLGDPADRPRIQLLAVRLLAGQNDQGGWTYTCIEPVPAAAEHALRAGLEARQLVAGDRPAPAPPAPAPPAPAGKAGAVGKLGVAGTLHADVVKYQRTLEAVGAGRHERKDDNSNTQFGILGVWVARRHGVPVEPALDRIERRFLATQNPQTGGWPYSGHGDGSPSMTCAGLLGLATGVGRREERALVAGRKAGAARPDAAPVPPADPAAATVARGLTNLGGVLAGRAPAGGGKGKGKDVNLFDGDRPGGQEMYFLWSLERVGVVYGVEKIGGVDWYAAGAAVLLPAQNADGSWGGKGGYGVDVDTAFALLFLARSNPFRDLTAKLRREPVGAELRAGAGAKATAPAPVPAPAPALAPAPVPVAPRPVALPAPAPAPVDDLAARAGLRLAAPGPGWADALDTLRDGKGPAFTTSLAAAIPRLDAERKVAARAALADRLARLTADTLRGMMTGPDVEVRRAAVLAAAMRDDKAHVSDLLARLTDDEEVVVRAARAGLRSLAGGDVDHGPEPGATPAQRRAAAELWRTWWLRNLR